MNRYLIAYLATAIVMVALDMLWLRVIAADWYRQGMGHLMAGQVNFVAAGLFYLLFPLGLVIFAVSPSFTQTAWSALAMGALFGCFAYGTYDLTNLAVLKNWPVGLTVIDIAWGAFASGVASLAGRAAVSVIAT